MIWPGRNLVLLALVPALGSLALLPAPAARPALWAIDAALAVATAVGLLVTWWQVRASRFAVTRTVGAVASLGEPQTVELTLENRSGRPRRLVVRDDVPETFAADPPEFDVVVPGRSRVVLEYAAMPHRRGTYHFTRVDALADGPLGLWRRSLRWSVPTTVRVYPDVRQIGRYALLARRDKLAALGVRRSRKLGSDNEFERLRDYIEGDEPRHIDWRSSARRQKLTVRAHQTNQSQRVVFLIDSGRMMAGDTGEGLSPLDHAFNSMLMLAHVALVQGDQVGVLVYSDRIRAYVPVGGGPRRINRIVHAVHDVFPELVESRHDRAFVELERRSRRRSLVILMTNVFDDVNAEQLQDHLANIAGRHLPLGVLLRDRDLFALADQGLPPDGGPTPARSAAAASMLIWRDRVLAGLRRRGVLTLDVFPDELTAPLVNQYLDIKARHLL